MKFRSSRKKVISIAIISIVLLLIIATICALLIVNKVQGEKIDYLFVSSLPNKTHYYVGDELEVEGLSIQVILNNGDFYFVDETQCQISGFDSSKPNDSQKVTVTYQGYRATFNVIIKEPPQPIPVLTGIYLSKLPKTEYKVGEWIDVQGSVVMRQYQDGTEKPIDMLYQYIVDGWVIDAKNGIYATNQPGEYELTVKYHEGGIVKYTTYTITVTE